MTQDSSGSDSGSSEEGSNKKASDSRLKWFREKVMASMVGVTRQKWNKMMENTVCLYALRNFCEEDDQRWVLFYLKHGVLIASLLYPDELKSKSLYFIKRHSCDGPLSLDSLDEHVYQGDLGPDPLAQLSLMTDELYAPLLKNRKNHAHWPAVVATDILRHFHTVASNIYVIGGLAKGKTLLPLPPDADEGDQTAQDKSLVHQLESAVIEWTHQVQAVVKSTSLQMKRQSESELPRPLEELDFWRAKADNLQCINEQLRDEKMEKIGTILEITRSSYFPAFQNIYEEVYAAMLEAYDIHKCLEPLRNYLVELEDVTKSLQLVRQFKSLIHVLSLVWKEAEYYTISHLVLIVQEIIGQVMDHLMENEVDGERIFKIEAHESAEKLEAALYILNGFKDTFLKYKTQLSTETPERAWRVDNDVIFQKMDKFMVRLRDILQLVQTIVEFRKLEKVEIGGSKGQILTAQVGDIFSEFDKKVQVFQTITYDPLDITDDQYPRDAKAFRNTIVDLEQRISTVIADGFEDCVAIVSAFKLLDSFAGMLHRPAIKREYEHNYLTLLDKYAVDLDVVYQIFLTEQDNPPIASNLPAVAGALMWSKNLRDRAEQPYGKLMELGKNLNQLDSRACRDAVEKHDLILKHLAEYDASEHAKWGAGIDVLSQQKLDLPLLRRSDDERTIAVNFDPALVILLREVKYLQQLRLEIPESAGNLYEQSEDFRHFISNLDAIVNRYNGIVRNMIEVEEPLVEDKLTEINRLLEKGLESITWKSSGIGEFITDIARCVNALGDILGVLKANVNEIESMMKRWQRRPLVERKDPRKVLDVKEAHVRLRSRSLEIELQGAKIQALIRESQNTVHVERDFPPWKDYVTYVDGIVSRGFYETARSALQYLLEQMRGPDGTAQTSFVPVFEIHLRLDVPEVVFSPPLAPNGKSDLKQIIMDLMGGIVHIGALVKRLDNATGDTYFGEMNENQDLSRLRTEILDMVAAVINDCLHYKNDFMHYHDLWITERDEYMEQFLLYGKMLAMDQEELLDEDPEESPPTLEDFEHQIDQQLKYHESVKAIHSSTPFNWLKVDARPFKSALTNIIMKWKHMFTQYLYDDVVKRLENLKDFIAECETGLRREVAEGDYAALVETMSLLRDIRARQDETDAMFEPIKLTIHLLKRYGIEFPQEIPDQLADLPQDWANLKKLMFTVKDSLTSLQSEEVKKIKEHRAYYVKDVARFRNDFLEKAPFSFAVPRDTVYSILDQWHHKTTDMEQRALDLADQEGLFELSVVEYKEVVETRRDLMNLKGLWDLVCLVRYQFDVWKATPWLTIDTDQMESDSKQFLKMLKEMRECKQWDAYQTVEVYIKNLMKSLRSVALLRDPAMRDRHWRQLMNTTGVHFDISGEVKLEELLSLQLHKYDETVRTVVEKATLELQMERQLSELDLTWKDMEFVFDTYKDNVPVLRTMEELMESLEENNVTLQNMRTSKYVSYFVEKISEWEQRLANVDSVIHLWLDVQRDWMHLESIFLDSVDIREQLPEDSKRFDRIDREWRQLMDEAKDTPNVVDACSKANLLDTLENLEGELAACSKSLDEYLDTKRLAFPRFYFISKDDLLDILAKGNDPLKVSVHLFKLFDAIKRIDFSPDNAFMATAMHSPEGEVVQFDEPCNCEGPVEVWLDRLINTMRKTLRGILAEAIETYEEMPREEWLFKYPSQISLTGSQVWWTSEVEGAFARLEEGYDNALKEYYKKQKKQLTNLIRMLQGDMEKSERSKAMTICTIDTHARDVIQHLMDDKAEDANEFGWQSQLRFRWDEEKSDCFINICDAEFQYQYEYLGNTGRLVITPLTDRCYITLTQSLRLIMGGAPAGPAGTGKTETTKDLGRALGIRVLVQNCSPQQTYLDMANIFKGLAQSGMWGCFDEFNRISIDVLSVVATQVKAILDGIRANKPKFNFVGEEINLVKTVGMFITMNPGYAGRTELPDNLKALFRPVSMVVPDLDRICEIMLMAEGFEEAKELSLKFTTLYALSKELLSKAGHYDWGLRAIKSVLVVAGKLKRDEPSISEKAILMRALRDFNLPKIITEDVPVFKFLIGDLFPAMDLQRKENPSLEKAVTEQAIKRGLQAETMFVLKCVQLDEILEVRHSVFIIGPSGSAKTEVWKTLAAAYTSLGQKCMYRDLNPKAVDSKELFGYKHPVTKEPMDGLFSSIMRDLAKIDTPDPKWIVLDGDIDPDWIESLNTVMDDNKVLTLPSNERVQLNKSMRLLFEIGNVKHATPATVSRAGILYLNESDVGWDPFFRSWTEKRKETHLSPLFDRYVQSTLDHVRKTFVHVIEVSDFQMVQTLCYMLDGLLIPENVPPGSDREVYEIYFIFAVVWAIGGSLINDPINPHRVDFSKWFKSEFKSIKFPNQRTVFDYRVDNNTHKWVAWADAVPSYVHDPYQSVSSSMVHTAETWCVNFWVNMFIKIGRPIMLVGNTGCGKTHLIKSALAELKNTTDDYTSCTINFNYYTDSSMLQSTMENQPPLERKVGKDFGPPGTKKLIYFIDDITMPQLDEYETQTPHTLLRQHIDYGHWYDRGKWEIKNIKRCQYVACLNPKTGSFSVNPRLQRHFAVLSMMWPSRDSLNTIYSSILKGHFETAEPAFSLAVTKYVPKIVEASLDLHQRVAGTFLPTAIKFHYQFNMRSLAQLFQGLLNSHQSVTRTPVDLCQLWVHESNRVYADVLTTQGELDVFKKMADEAVRRNFDFSPEEIHDDPLIFAHFANGMGDPFYSKSPGFSSLSKILMDGLAQHNEFHSEMDLVLFNDAMLHVVRVSRIIMSPKGSALLVGVGGSGKQSLARLAAFVNSMDVFQMQIKSTYGVQDLKNDLVKMYKKIGKTGDDMVFLLTDAQVVDESFLIYINDLLASGNIPGLFPPDEADTVIASLRSEVKQAGIMDTRENVWAYFIQKVHRHLHVVLCFSPVGGTLRNRYRCFPALVNCTSIDWFHPWPHEALLSVSSYFLEETDIDASIKQSVVDFVAFAHGSVEEASVKYLQSYRRHNYTTPKSFLELIKLYKALLRDKRDNIFMERQRLLSGLERLKGASEQVAHLHEKLDAQKIDLDAKSKAADEIVEVLGRETEKVSKERENAEAEEAKTNAYREEVAIQQAACDEDLKKAEPALIAAEAALKTFSKDDLTNLARMPRPPKDVMNVLAAVMIIQSPEGRLKRDVSWKAAQQHMGNVGRFYESLLSFDRDNIPKENLKAVQPYLKDKNFTPKVMVSKSTAASGICGWVINIVEYHKVYEYVQPKREALAEANSNLEAAENRLEEMRKKLHKLDLDLKHLTEKFEEKNSEKMAMEREAENTRVTIELANRLVSGLASEGSRWSGTLSGLDVLSKTLVGDVLLASGFISYIGAFNRVLRHSLLNEQWLPWLQEHEVPLSEGYEPLKILTSDAQIAQWNNEGLPDDPVSLENAAICSNCQRWPLLVDPQLQGIQWIKQRSDLDLIVVRLDQDRYMDLVMRAISDGAAVLIEGVGEDIDPQLDPLLGRNLINKGRNIKLGDKIVDFNPDFKLFLQTRLGNPHFKPELQAQTTLINFTVTEDGLEDQLLATVVTHERQDLEEQRATLIRTLNEYEIKLKELESHLLQKLQEAEGDFLSDTKLVENLENTKATADDINVKKKTAQETQATINTTRNAYRPVASRASLLYFLLNDLSAIDHMYQFSLKAFVVVFLRSIERCAEEEEEKPANSSDEDFEMEEIQDSEATAMEALRLRVERLVDAVTYAVFMYAARGLFERHKLIFVTMMAFRIMSQTGTMDNDELGFLLRGGTSVAAVSSKVDWCSDQVWRQIIGLSQNKTFESLPDDIEGSSSRWKKWSEEQLPEITPMPQDWKNKSPFQKLCIVRALRPDRLINAVTRFICEYAVLGTKYTESKISDLASTFAEAGPQTPIFFILSPGVDPVKSVEAFGKLKGYTEENNKFKNVSLGQGQEEIAMEYLDYAHKEGAWVILQNIHLMTGRQPPWLPVLEKKLDELSIGAHEDYRVFLSAEPASGPGPDIPIGILQSSIKVTNEPPSGMKANMARALSNFDQDALEQCSKESEFHRILFTMCFFHAVVVERRKFGSQGWNRPYNFNTGDLTISVDVLNNYLENNSKVPWEDLRYIFGEIMYGGHISDNWDRRLCSTYLSTYLTPELLDDDTELVTNYPPPPFGSIETYHKYIEERLPEEDPSMFGLNRNAEIGFLTEQSTTLFMTILNLQPTMTAGSTGGSREDKVSSIMKQVLTVLDNVEYNMPEMYLQTENKTHNPYVVVALQECERMNMLVGEIKRSLNELQMGMQGDLMMSEQMESIMSDLYNDFVPSSWADLAYPSLKPLSLWVEDLVRRVKQLDKWTGADFKIKVMWLPGLFNPQSFLTAIMQSTARNKAGNLPLDRMKLQTEVTKKSVEDIQFAKAEGAYISGLLLEGARWDSKTGQLADAMPKELYCTLPVVFVKAVTIEKGDDRDQYLCPVYKTRQRGPTFVWGFQLKCQNPSKWIMAGAAILLSAE